jgi:hypothetical protein
MTNAFQGVAIFNTLSVQQTQAQSPADYALQVTGNDANDKPLPPVTSNQFTVNPPPSLVFNKQAVNPQIRFVNPPKTVPSGQVFSSSSRCTTPTMCPIFQTISGPRGARRPLT